MYHRNCERIWNSYQWEHTINFYQSNKEKNLIQLYEELFNKKISVISRKLIVSDASSLAA